MEKLLTRYTTSLKQIFLLTVSLSLGLFLISSSLCMSADVPILDITSPETRKFNFAVPSFTGNGSGNVLGLSKKMTDILANSLKFHGIISIVPSGKYGGDQAANWKNVGADYTVLGKFTASTNTVTIELRLLEVISGNMILGKKYKGPTKQVHDMLYRFCDNVIRELTGTEGIAQSQIVFVSDESGAKEAHLTDILGRKKRQVTRHQNLVVSPRFTPNSTHLSYTSYHSGNQNLYITDLRQSKVTRVISRRKGMNLAPAWAPNGKQMVVTLSKDGNPDLYLLDNKGRVKSRLTRGNGINVSPSWSPDGSKLVFVSDRSGKPQLFLMDMKNKNVQRLTFTGSENAEPSWSPTENLITYSSLISGVYQICSIAPQVGAARNQITKDLSHHESPSWSPDGNQIIFSKRDGRRQRVYAIMKNGSYQRALFTFPGNQTYPRWSKNY